MGNDGDSDMRDRKLEGDSSGLIIQLRKSKDDPMHGIEVSLHS